MVSMVNHIVLIVTFTDYLCIEDGKWVDYNLQSAKLLVKEVNLSFCNQNDCTNQLERL